MASIFDRMRLGPSQMRTVADRRLGDADCLRHSNDNARANGAMYLGGFVIECLLKAQLLEKYRWLGMRGPRAENRREQRLYELCYRQHDLEGILNQLPELSERLLRMENTGRAHQILKSLCATWTVFARYSPRTETMRHAAVFLDQVKEVKRWLEQQR